MATVTGVVIPARNEVRSVATVVQATTAALPGAHVIVVDDASWDATAQAAGEAGASVVRLSAHVGYAQALRVGYQTALDAGATQITQIDADGQHVPADLIPLIQALDRYDIVLGSRFLGPGYPMPLCRRLGIAACRAMTRMVGGFAVTDPTSGFRAMRTPVARTIAAHGFPDGLTESSFLIRLHRQGFAIGEVPVSMHPPRNGSMHDGLAGVTHLARISRATLGLALNRTRG